MAERKHLSEFAVSLFSAGWLLFPANQLTSKGSWNSPEMEELSKRCHIYLICARPSFSIDPKTFIFDEPFAQGNLVYRIDGQEHTVPFRQGINLSDGAITARVSPYPHREIQIVDAEGNPVRYIPAIDLSVKSVEFKKELRELEVLYVGQAYAGGRRSALDRLKSHSTLQKILADLQYESPDKEVLVLTFEYSPYRVISSFQGLKDNMPEKDDTAQRFVSIHDHPLTEQQQVCLAEAGLIRYFQPKYNDVYKASFPASDQKILFQCYELDFSALITEIDTEEWGLALYSKAAKPMYHHIARFDLVDLEERRSFFTFELRDGEILDHPGAIPRSR